MIASVSDDNTVRIWGPAQSPQAMPSTPTSRLIPGKSFLVITGTEYQNVHFIYLYPQPGKIISL